MHAIDGDYMAIALLYYTKRGIDSNNQIFILRQLSKLKGSSAAAAATGQKQKKRKFSKNTGCGTIEDDDDAVVEYFAAVPDTTMKKTTVALLCCGKIECSKQYQKKKKEKCWVDMQLLYAVISQSMKQSMRGMMLLNTKTQAPFSDSDLVGAAVWLMLCAGTDFSRSLPLIGPKRIWEHLPSIAPALVQGFAMMSIQKKENHLLLNGVIGKLYKTIFAKHISDPSSNLKNVLERLKREDSKISNRTKALLPSEAQILTTFKNISWVILYWTEINSCVESPLDGSHGFVLDHVAGASSSSSSKNVTFEDLALA